MRKIEFTAAVKFGESNIDEINVQSLTFIEMSKLWKSASQAKGKVDVVLQRLRIMHQTHFMASGVRVVPDETQIRSIPFTVAKVILEYIDEGQGRAGKLLNEGDGATTAILYKLGTPFAMKNAKGDDSSIEELEFMASTYGELEDVLAADNDISKTLELIRKIAKPVGSNLQALPAWALDRLTVADGVTIMQKVLPAF